MSNILQAVNTIVSNDIPNVVEFYRSQNKINAVGDALELFIKDIFANTVNETLDKKLEKYGQIFSYAGNANNPPDFMVLGGDAVEVKKIESQNAQIALNSSYPTSKLRSDSPMITKACRDCEQWSEKDLLYAIGSIKKKTKKLSLLWLIYGDCYAASPEVYTKMRQNIISGIEQTAGVEFSQTKELGRVNKVDPLGITSLRIRGMWQIEHPEKVYQYLMPEKQTECNFRLTALMREAKYQSFPIEDRTKLESIDNQNLQNLQVKVKSPDNPIKRVAARLIQYQI